MAYNTKRAIIISCVVLILQLLSSVSNVKFRSGYIDHDFDQKHFETNIEIQFCFWFDAFSIIYCFFLAGRSVHTQKQKLSYKIYTPHDLMLAN